MSEFVIPEDRLECGYCGLGFADIDAQHDQRGIRMYVECNLCGRHWYYEVSADE